MKLARPALLSICLLASGTLATAAAPAWADTPRLDAFQTPSGNIGCIADDGGAVRCDIAQFSYAPPPKPDSCELDWGMAFGIEPDGSVRFLCVSDTTLSPDHPKPPAGSHVAIGQSVCAVQERSVECVVDQTDGGLHLEAERYWTSFEE